MAKLPELTKIYISAYSDQAIQLGDAVPGFAGVEQLEDGGQYSCVVKNGVQTEKFIGTYSVASQSLTRQTQNVYPAGADKISLAADGLFVDFVLLARDLPNDDGLKATLQGKGGASFVQSVSGSIESRLSNLDTEMIDTVSGTLGANTSEDDGLVKGLVYVKQDNSLKATYQDSTGIHTTNVQKTNVLDSLGESATDAISQRAATDALTDKLSGTVYENPQTKDGTGIGLHWQGNGGAGGEGLPNFQYFLISDETKTPVFANLITKTYFEKYTEDFVTSDNIPTPDLSGLISGTPTAATDKQITSIVQDSTGRPKATLSDGSAEILALESDVTTNSFETGSYPSSTGGTVYYYKVGLDSNGNRLYKLSIVGAKASINSSTKLAIPTPSAGYSAPSYILSATISFVSSITPIQIYNSDGSSNPDYPYAIIVPMLTTPSNSIRFNSVSGATSGATLFNVEFTIKTAN